MSGAPDTIAAVATPPGAGAVAMIRVSGPDSISALDALFECAAGRVAEAASHTVHYGRLRETPGGPVIDDGCVTVFRAPRSYTGEDTVEISLHGNPLIAARALEALVATGRVRPARAGEFTRRAFLNGKMDLAQAEAVADLIQARSRAALHSARQLRDGDFSKTVKKLREALLEAASQIELAIDFPDEAPGQADERRLLAALDRAEAEILSLVRSYERGKHLRDGVEVVIAGPVNAGKSSLLNALTRQPRAIVSPVPGTTRDLVREDLWIDGVMFRLADTAGLRGTRGRVEAQGQAKTREALEKADLVLWVSDARRGFSPVPGFAMPARKTLRVLNKTDLGCPCRARAHARVSALTGEGIENLLALLRARALKLDRGGEETPALTRLRHVRALEAAAEALVQAREALGGGLGRECAAVDVRGAVGHLEEIVGLAGADAVLDRIFAEFCIGK